MASRDPTTWMWAQACQLLEEAERMHRDFFRLAGGARVAWEPPVDVYEDNDAIYVVVALPGVAPDRVEVVQDPRGLLVRAERRLPFEDEACSVRRLEIPHGYFERHIPLPAGPLEAPARKWMNGCLVLTLRKRA